MHKSLILLLALSWSLLLGYAQESVPAIRILPEDIIQDSIRQVQFGTNKFMVRWTYTEAGAKKMLSFWEAHEGKKACTIIGDFKPQPGFIAPHSSMPPRVGNYAAWKEGWLKRRTDKFFGISEDDANKIVAGLKGK